MHLKFHINGYDYPITKNVIAMPECVTIINYLFQSCPRKKPKTPNYETMHILKTQIINTHCGL